MTRPKSRPAPAPGTPRLPRGWTSAVVESLIGWFQDQARDLPWRHTLDPYGIWISEIMLQQTQVRTVIPYWERWMRELPDVRALAAAAPDQVLKLWEGLGYYTRARNLQKAAQVVVAESGGRFPIQPEAVLNLPGIGPYTAGAICSIAGNRPAPILDGNVIRVLTRLRGITGNPRDRAINQELWELARELVREAHQADRGPFNVKGFTVSGRCSALNQSLMELGALVCTPRQARCAECPLHGRCVARRTQTVDALPNLAKRARPTARRFIAFAMEHEGRWLLRQRPAGGVNARLWEFPNLEVDARPLSPRRVLARDFQIQDGAITPLPPIRHAITRYRITVESYHVALPRRAVSSAPDARWLVPAEIEALALTSAHRKLWEQALKHVGTGATSPRHH